MRKILAVCLCMAIVVLSPVSTYAAEGSNLSKILAGNVSLREKQPGDDVSMLLWTVSDTGAIFPMIESDDKSVKDLSGKISRNITSDYRKAMAFHDWVADNIYYDYDAYEDISAVGGETAAITLKRKIALCEGMSNLLIGLLRAADIPARAVNGFALTLTGEYAVWTNAAMREESNHQWAEAYIADEQRWITIDPTWDSGNSYSKGKFTYGGVVNHKYFDISDKDLARDHRSLAYEYYTFETGNADGYYSDKDLAYFQAKDVYSRVSHVYKTTVTPIPVSALYMEELKNYAYSGEKIIPAVKLYVPDGETSDFWNMRLRFACVLKRGVDFKITVSGNVNIGTATVTITGMGRFCGERTETFKIISAKGRNPKVSKN